ncbi:MAG: IMP cyclohydrolase [Oscillospiraceae bacterium]|jgi:IMP cyclohydrolase|nr:IMP cyclohydrolase [Oscillospiraceae bacterium]
MQKLNEILKSNAYPGRGIIIGKSADSEHAIAAYFTMGRSENSRNRVFVENGGGIKTKAFDESKMTDPSLVIYNAVRILGSKLIVTNGDQTDTIAELMDRQQTFEQSLRTREYEPDPPIYTSRISGILHFCENNFNHFNYAMSVLKRDSDDHGSCLRYNFAYNDPKAGRGRFIHVYKCDGNPPPSFEGEPVAVEIEGDIDTFTNMLWNALNEENKVSLWTRFINLKTGKYESRIINKNGN